MIFCIAAFPTWSRTAHTSFGGNAFACGQFIAGNLLPQQQQQQSYHANPHSQHMVGWQQPGIRGDFFAPASIADTLLSCCNFYGATAVSDRSFYLTIPVSAAAFNLRVFTAIIIFVPCMFDFANTVSSSV